MSIDSTSAVLRFSTRELAPARSLPALQELFDRSVQLKIDTAPGHAVEMEMLVAPGVRRARMLSPLTANVERSADMLADREDKHASAMLRSGFLEMSR